MNIHAPSGLFHIAGAALMLALAASSVSSAVAAGPAPSKTKAPVAGKKSPAQKTKPTKGASAKAKAAKPAPLPPEPEPERSEPAARLIAWVQAEHDNGALPYIVIDKQAALLRLFDAKGELLGFAPVLLGVGVGDDSSPGVGAKELAEIGPAERTTPAGRFVAKFGRVFKRQRVLWVDYANSVALHAVITTHKEEQRVERLQSPTPDDNRITFGCINVGTGFYAKQISPLFQKKGGIVYILPDTKSLDDVFPRVRLLPYLDSGGAGKETEDRP